jgi:general secretion pathway protein H
MNDRYLPSKLAKMNALKRADGFTLIELMVVAALVALLAGIVALALPQPEDQILEQESQQLLEVFERHRLLSLQSPTPWVWQASATGFSVTQLTPSANRPSASGPLSRAYKWLDPQTQLIPHTPGTAKAVTSVPLGPEPFVEPQKIILQNGPSQIWLVTDGLAPLHPQTPDADVPSVPQ